MQRLVRTRYAPSPTGSLHLGGLRTALFNALFAQSQGGKFLLRIEDTDQTRLVPGAAEQLLSTLQRCNLHPSPGHFRQSDRLPLYRSHVDKLLTNKSAYRCFCSRDRLDLVRRHQRQSGAPTRYDRACLHVPHDEAEDRAAAGEEHTVRLRVNRTGRTVLHDVVHGITEFENDTVDDQILLKSDGFPTYHLASVVDDHDMEITHVIRGEEWIASTPKHLMLYDAFGWTPPSFVHLPLLLNSDGSKLSKRQGDVAAEQFLDKGYLPSALNNFISLLGWHPSKGEHRELFFTFEELAQSFTLEDINRTGSIVDTRKLDWFNSQHIRHLAALPTEPNIDDIKDRVTQRIAEENKSNREALLKQVAAALTDSLIVSMDTDPSQNEYSHLINDVNYVDAVTQLLSERVFFPIDYVEFARHFFVEQLNYADKELQIVQAKSCKDAEITKQRLELCLEKFSCEKLSVDAGGEENKVEEEDGWTAVGIKVALDSAVKELGKSKKPGHVMMPLRWATTGLKAGAGLPETLELLGRERTLLRISRAIALLATTNSTTTPPAA